MSTNANNSTGFQLDRARSQYVAAKKHSLTVEKLKDYSTNLYRLKSSLLPFICLAGAVSMFAGGWACDNQLESDSKNNIPATIFKGLGITALCSTVALSVRLKEAPWGFLRYYKNMRRIKKGYQTVSKKVFDSLHFQKSDDNRMAESLYRVLDRETLEEKTKFLDMSMLTPSQQIELLQMIIDTCDKYPSMARMFRHEIFPIHIQIEKLDDDKASAYCTRSQDKPTVIQARYEDLITPDNFMHEYLHVMQDLKGLFLDNYYEIDALAEFMAEANAHAVSCLCLMDDKTDGVATRKIYKQSLAEVRQQHAAGKIKMPEGLSKIEKKRFLKGVAEERTIGRLMEMFLSEPYDFKTLFGKTFMHSQLEPWEDKEAQRKIKEFQENYNESDVFTTMNKYPHVYRQLLDYYSNKLSYQIEPSCARNNGLTERSTSAPVVSYITLKFQQMHKS